eukprot:CAMPEP_0114017112 /NCGR_PEP_ID=MMETSP0372-20130328/14304_1 /TAXON_ID=340204 /ORGANISM="Lankesteria abbotti" /LENGTH=44 /assembly_acc=CAM_ASM_000359
MEMNDMEYDHQIVEFESEWPKLESCVPFGQLPVLQLPGGESIAE